MDPSVEGLWKTTQENAFTVWVNDMLKRHPDGALDRVSDLRTGFSDGLKLVKLVEALTKDVIHNVEKDPSTHRVKQVSNCNSALDAMRKGGVKLGTISGEDIVDGNLRSILGMLWALVAKYQDVEEKGDLMKWLQMALKEYNLKPTNFTTSWRSGLEFCALLHCFKPDLFDYDTLDPNDTVGNLEFAFSNAEMHLAIPRLLDVHALTDPAPDELSILTYLSYFRALSKDAPPEKIDWKKRWREARDVVQCLKGELAGSSEASQEEWERMKDEKKQLITKLEGLHEKLEAETAKLAPLQGEIRKIETTNGEIRSGLFELTTRLTEISKDNAEKIGRIKAISEEKGRLLATRDELRQRVEGKQAEVDNMAEVLKRAQAEREEQVHSMENEVDTLRTKLEGLKIPVLTKFRLEGEPIIGCEVRATGLFSGFRIQDCVFKWYHADDHGNMFEVPGPNKDKYLVTSVDHKRMVKCICQPISEGGTRGEPVPSQVIGPVSADLDMQRELDTMARKGEAEFLIVLRGKHDYWKRLRITRKARIKIQQEGKTQFKFDVKAAGFRIDFDYMDPTGFSIRSADRDLLHIHVQNPRHRDLIGLLIMYWVPKLKSGVWKSSEKLEKEKRAAWRQSVMMSGPLLEEAIKKEREERLVAIDQARRLSEMEKTRRMSEGPPNDEQLASLRRLSQAVKRSVDLDTGEQEGDGDRSTPDDSEGEMMASPVIPVEE